MHALKPDPEKAYSHAIKAVESAAHAIVEPSNAKGHARHDDRAYAG